MWVILYYIRVTVIQAKMSSLSLGPAISVFQYLYMGLVCVLAFATQLAVLLLFAPCIAAHRPFRERVLGSSARFWTGFCQ